MPDEEDANPYAPPAADAEPEPPRTRRNAFESERRPVVVCILLTLVTCGIYSGIWLLRRKPFLDGLRVDPKLGALPAAVLGLTILTFVLAFVTGAAGNPRELASVEQMLSTGAGVVTLIANFRAAAILRSEFRRSGRLLTVSGVATFFFGIFYLQYKINEGADVAPRSKKKKKSPEAAAIP